LNANCKKCGEACPDKPELDRIRQNTLEAIERDRFAAEDANSFIAALGNEEALTAYSFSCAVKKCEFRNEAAAERDALRRARQNKAQADAEERQFSSSHGDISALKRYVSECVVCASARPADREIEELSEKSRNWLFHWRYATRILLPLMLRLWEEGTQMPVCGRPGDGANCSLASAPKPGLGEKVNFIGMMKVGSYPGGRTCRFA
jgi:hypothetical protein